MRETEPARSMTRYDMQIRRDLSDALKWGIHAIERGLVCDMEDAALVAKSIRDIAIRDESDRVEAGMEFDTTIDSGLSDSHTALSRRQRLVAFLNDGGRHNGQR